MIFLYLISFLVFYRLLCVKNKPILRFIYIIYIVSICSAAGMWYLFPEYSRNYDLSLVAIFYHIVVLISMMLPLNGVDKRINVSKVEIKYSTLLPFIVFIVTLSLTSIVSSFYTYSLIFDSGVSIVDGRNTSMMGDSFMRVVKPNGGFLAHVSTIASEFSFVSLFLSFFVRYKYPKEKKTYILLFISSFSAIFYQLEWFGRENIVRFIFDFVFVYLIFNKSYSIGLNTNMIKYSILGMTLLLSVFLFITFMRFDKEVYEAGPLYGVISYLGQGFIYFSSFFEAFKYTGKTGGRSIFAIFFSEDQQVGILNQADQFGTFFDVSFNSFGTYVATFVNDVNAYYAVLIFFILILLFKKISMIKPNNIFFYVYLLWIFRFFASGIFYWIDILNTGDRLISILLVLFLNFIYKEKYKKV